MNVNRIISESIDRYINNLVTESRDAMIDRIIDECIISEAKKKSKNKGGVDVLKKGKKLRRGLRTDFNMKKERETNPNLNLQDAEDLNDVLDSDLIDVAALAKRVYPDHTPQGAQSQLRKKIKGLKSDSGSTYKLKKKEAFKIRRELAKEI